MHQPERWIAQSPGDENLEVGAASVVRWLAELDDEIRDAAPGDPRAREPNEEADRDQRAADLDE